MKPLMYFAVRNHFFSFLIVCFCLLLMESEAAITRFEFIDDPNDGESLITDSGGNVGPTILGSFTYTVEATPADIRIMNQFENSPVFAQTIQTIADVDEGIPTNQDIPLFEGLTWLYLFARNPIGDGGGAGWDLGPLTFTSGDELRFLVDQGPPAAPTIGAFDIEGGRTLNLPTPTVRNFFSNFSPSNPEVFLEVFFNRVDVNIPGNSLQVTFVGTVVNNPAIFDNDPDTPPNPNPVATVARLESNALVAAQLGRILSGFPPTGPPLLVEFIGDVTSFTGPQPLAVALIDRSPGLSSPNITPARTGPALGEFSAIGFDFKTIPDGDYEVIVGARDAAHGETQRGLSPGAFNAFGTLTNPTPGIPRRILIRKDTVPPQAAILQSPPSVFIFGNTPPSVDPPFEDSIFSVRGAVGNERREPSKMHVFSQDSPNLDGGVNTGPFNDRIFFTDPNTGQFADLVDASAFEPVLTVPAYAPAGQVAYRFFYVPEDALGNVNVDNVAELFVIKDYAPPPTPVFTNLQDGDAITQRLFTVRAEAIQDPNSVLAEHGRVEFSFEIFRLTSSGVEGVQTFVIPASAGGLTPVTFSPLDDAFVATSQTIAITDPQGVPTGAVVTVAFPDATNRFANLVFDRFNMDRIVNFENVPDGILQFNLCLLDQVGNRSNPCTSVTVLKDLTGPDVALRLQDSGPDDNYENFPLAPNFLGADDLKFLISLKSPELTVDPVALSGVDPSFLITGIPLPDGLGLNLNGTAIDGFGITTQIRISGIRIPQIILRDINQAPGGTDISVAYNGFPFNVPQPPIPISTGNSVNWRANVPLFDLIDGVEEFIQIQATDNLGNLGAILGMSVIRDVNPPAAPVLQAPAPLPGTTMPVLYANTDTMLLQGTSEPNSRGFLLLPPPGSPPGFVIDSQNRIPRTTPGSIPIPGSLSDSTLSVCANLRCVPFSANDQGVFRIENVDISTVANSLSTPTIVWVQMIDSFDNTDPDLSVRPIEIHKNDTEAPLNKLSILNYPLAGDRVLIFPDSTVSSPWQTVFYSFDLVPMEMEAFFPMRKAPDVRLKQSGYVFKQAAKLPSVFPQELGTFTFRYLYEVEPVEFDFDGIVEFEVSGGEDFFGNPVARTTGLALIVDTVAPSSRASAPTIILSPVDSTLMTTIVSTRIDLEDWFKDQLTTQNASGLSTPDLKIELFGPLQSGLDSLAKVPLVTFLPIEPGFDLAARPAQPIATDGTYRFEYLGRDIVGNEKRFYRTFFLDRKGILEPLFLSNPEDKSFVSTMPVSTNTGPHNSVSILDFEADFSVSDFSVFGPGNVELESVKSVDESKQSIYRAFTTTSLPATDGTSDGIYEIRIRAADKTGNITLKTHTYTYDTLPPVVLQSFPMNGVCVSDLPLAQLSLMDRAGVPQAISGIDRKRTNLKLELMTPYLGYNFFPPGSAVDGVMKFLSQDPSGEATQIAALEFRHAGLLGMPKDGTRDGLYRLYGDVTDLASNQVSFASTLILDTLIPTISVTNLGDLEFITSQTFRFEGHIADRGCGFLKNSSGTPDLSALVLNIYQWNPDTEQAGNLLVTTRPHVLNPMQPSDYPAETEQAAFIIEGIAPVIAGLPGRPGQASFEFVARDVSGNLSVSRRILKLNPNTIPIPTRISPRSTSMFRGTTVSTVTSNPVLKMQWEAVAAAKSYKLHLSRESQTPGDRTTVIDLPANTLEYQVDFTYVTPTGAPVLPATTDEIYWFVEALDASRQGTPLAQFGRGEKIRLDSQVSIMSLTQVFFKEGETLLEPSHPDTFATSSVFEFVFKAPEKIRVYGDETVFVRFLRTQEIIPMKSGYQLPVETDELLFQFQMPNSKVNGQAVFHFQGFRDQAGNVLLSSEGHNYLQIPFKVDKGPEYQVKVFANPVDPHEFRYVFKGLDWDGRDDYLLWDPAAGKPKILVSQAMQPVLSMAELLPLQLVPLGDKNYARGIASGFRIDKRFVGDMRFTISAEDTRGRTVSDTVFLHVDNHRLPNNQSLGRLILGPREQAEYREPIVETRGRTVFSLGDFPYIHHQIGQEELNSRGRLELQTDCERLLFLQSGPTGMLIPPQTLSCHNGVLSYSIQSKNFNQVSLIRDSLPPDLDLANLNQDWEMGAQKVSILSQDGQSLVTSVAMISDKQIYHLNLTQNGIWEGELKFSHGRHDITVESTDAAGNQKRALATLNVLKPFEMERCATYPNPIRSRGYLDCVFTRTPEELSISVHDAAGARISRIDLLPSSAFKEDLMSYLPPGIANGVYFIKLSARHGDRKRRVNLKFAILR